MTTAEKVEMTHADWLAEGKRRFGDDFLNWKFQCPACKCVYSGQEMKDAGGQANDMGQDCIGRHNSDKGCDWAAYGLFRISPVTVVFDDGHEADVFGFAPEEEKVAS